MQWRLVKCEFEKKEKGKDWQTSLFSMQILYLDMYLQICKLNKRIKRQN